MLACNDFSAEIGRHRLWFAGGPGWEGELARLFEDQPGLPMPSQFIRVPVGEPAAGEPVIAAAQARVRGGGGRAGRPIPRRVTACIPPHVQPPAPARRRGCAS